MIAGHLAAGMAIKGAVPTAPTWALLIAAVFLDVLNPIFVLTGLERAVIVNWSHSLAMSLVWAVLFGTLFVWRGRTIALAVGIAVFSHFVLDAILQSAVPLWPYSSVHIGLDLERILPTGWWFVELALVAGGVFYYWTRAREQRLLGKTAWVLAAFVLIVHILNSPWFSPA
ncbi:MAG: metal-dependent hydrolase [Vicinamibacterales bacterium]